MSSWFNTSRNYKDVAPIGEQAKRFILENCEYSLLLRQDRKFQCLDHWDSASNSPKHVEGLCPTCLGLGYKITPQIVPARFSGTAENRIRFVDERTPIGELALGGTVAYFPKEVCPGSFDIIARCEWNIDTRDISQNNIPRIIKIRELFIIRSLFTHFEREISFFSATLGPYPTEKQLLDSQLAALSDIDVLDLLPRKEWW